MTDLPDIEPFLRSLDHVSASLPTDVELFMTRPFQAGEFAFAVATSDPAVCDTVERLLADLSAPPLQECPAPAIFVLIHDGQQPDVDSWSLTGPVLIELESARMATALAMLITSINLSALAAEPERLHLHAACVARFGNGVVISAARDTGKTTTVARLVLRDWDYVSDEAVSLGPEGTLVRGFAKPLSIKPEGRHQVAELGAHLVPSLDIIDTDVLHVPLGEAGSKTRDEVLPAVVVLLRRALDDAPAREAAFREMHPADAVVSLMAETMDAGRYGRRAAIELARLAASCRCVELLAGTPDSTADLIEGLIAEHDHEPKVVAELSESVHICADVVTVQLGDRVVIHELESGRILALDAMATRIWLKIGDWMAADDIDLAGPVVAPFVDQLRSLGLVRETGIED